MTQNFHDRISQPELFDKVVQRCEKKLRPLLRGGAEEASDFMQKALQYFLEKAERMDNLVKRDDEYFANTIAQKAFRLKLDEIRASRHILSVNPHQDEEGNLVDHDDALSFLAESSAIFTDDPASIFEEKAAREALHAKISSVIKGRQLEALMYVLKGYSIDETAKAMDITLSAVQKHIFRATKAIRKAFNE